jgi:hypothetical protein
MTLMRSFKAVMFCTAGFLAPVLHAQVPGIEVKITGASFFEAPPNRDKNLAVFSTGASQEKVEVHALLSSSGKLFAEFGGSSLFDKADVKVTAVLSNKSTVALGSADVGSFPKLSSDGKIRAISVSVSRLPDQPVQGLIFEGTVPIAVARGLVKASALFEPKAPYSLKLGALTASIAKVDGQTISLKGNETLAQMHSLYLQTADGRKVTAERRSWGRINNEVSQEWTFASPLSAGTLHAENYEGLENIKLPLRLVVGKPY